MIRLLRSELARTRRLPHCCKNVQPESTFGGPETLIDRGVQAVAKLTEEFIGDIEKALIGKTTEKAILGALSSAPSRFDAAGVGEVVEAELTMGLMLGALDAAYEVDENVAVDATTFRMMATGDTWLSASLVTDRVLMMGVQLVEADRKFAARPLEQAIRSFLKKQVVTKDVFDDMTAQAKKRAFTVARMASTAMIDTVKSELANTLDRGADLRDFRTFARTRLEGAGWTPASKSHVETIFRTNVMEAYSAGRHRQMTQPAVLALRPYWQVLNPNDGPPRQRKTHQECYQKVFRADDPVFPGAIPPWDYNSFLPHTVVQGSFVGASRALYAWHAVELTTAKGRRLSVTADHPVLTPGGFVRACLLREGDELIGYRAEPGIASLRTGAQWHEDHPPARAEEVFRALAQTGTKLLRAVGHEFHGEAARMVGEIEIVGSYRLLAAHRQAAGAECTAKLALEAPDLGRAVALARGSEFSSDLQVARFGAAAQLDTPLQQGATDRLPADAILARQLPHRHPASIERDQVVRIRRFPWLGHVYDFQSSTGWLVADNVVVANCRDHLRSLSQRQVDNGGLTVQDGSFLTSRKLPAPGFGGGEGPPGTLVGPKVKEIPKPPPEQQPAPPAPKAPPKEPRRRRPPAPPPAPPEQPPAPAPPAPAPPAPPPAAPKPVPPVAPPKPKRAPRPRKPVAPPPASPPPPAPRPAEPKPKKPRAPKDMAAVMDKAKVSYKTYGVHPQIKGSVAVTAEHEAAVMRGMDKMGFARKGVPSDRRLRELEITGQAADWSTMDPTGEDGTLGDTVGGVYWRRRKQIRINVNPETGKKFLRNKRLDPREKHLPGNTQDVASSLAEVVEMTSAHEFAHHQHMSEFSDLSRKEITAAFKEMQKANPGWEVSVYGRTDEFEWWAEGRTAHAYYPRPWLEARAPKALQVIESVLKREGLL